MEQFANFQNILQFFKFSGGKKERKKKESFGLGEQPCSNFDNASGFSLIAMWKSTRGITLPSFGGNAMEPRATIPREGRRRKKRGEIFSQSSYDIGWYELTEITQKTGQE